MVMHHILISLHFRFLRTEEDDSKDSWEVNLAKRYYAKLFKEYAIGDLSRYKVGCAIAYQSAFIWHVRQCLQPASDMSEVYTGTLKGAFICRS